MGSEKDLDDKKLILKEEDDYYDEEMQAVKSDEEYTSNYDSKMTSTNKN